MARIIAIGGLKGGSSKTTLSINLACCLAEHNRVRLVDADPQASAWEWLEAGNLKLVCDAMPLEDKRGAATWIRKVSAIDTDILVIDLPPQTGAATAAALILADLFIVPVSPSSLDLRAASKALGMLKEARAERSDGKPAALLVPAKVDRRTGAGREIEAALHEMGEPVAPAIGLRTAFVDSASASDWIGGFAPRSIAHQEIAALAAVVDRVTRRKG